MDLCNHCRAADCSGAGRFRYVGAQHAQSRERMAQLQSDIKVGASIMFAGGIYGKIVKIKDDLIDVEVSKGVVIQISRYSIQTAE